jgi:hypothetical protein
MFTGNTTPRAKAASRPPRSKKWAVDKLVAGGRISYCEGNDLDPREDDLQRALQA